MSGARLRVLATAMLAAMAALFLLARWQEPLHPAWSWVRAFAEAALVGGLADWFAVTALFRHPLGLPIPHTAIIPRNKDRIGDAVGDFLERHLLTRRVLAQQLSDVDFAAVIVRWLLDPAQRRWLAEHLLHAVLSHASPGPLLADLLALLMRQHLQARLFDRAMDALSSWLDESAPAIYRKVAEKSPAWMPRRFNDAFYQRLMAGLDELVEAMRAPDSQARLQFDAVLRDWRDQLAAGDHDTMLTGRIREAMGEGLPHRRLEAGMLALAEGLATDPETRERLNRWARRQAVIMLVRQRRAVGGVVRAGVRSWDGATVAGRLEAYVGHDLQFIRLNGTVVGGMIGLILQGFSSVFQ